MNWIKIKQLLWVVLLAGLLIFLWFEPQGKGRQTGNGCLLDDGQCVVTLKDESFLFQSLHTPIELEEEIPVRFEFPSYFTAQKIWIEGINMYMGRIPVIIESQGKGWAEGVFYLGSCSEPHMRWQVIAEYKTGRETQQIRFLFETKR